MKKVSFIELTCIVSLSVTFHNQYHLYTKLRFKKLDASLTLNGALAGLVSITAGAANVSLVSSLIIGLLAGIIMTEGVRFLDVKLNVDDPVGAIAVHGITGIWETIAVGLFETSSGLFVGGGASLIGVQVLGILAVIVWVSITVSGFLSIVKVFSPIRVSKEEEIAGLDFAEHGSQAYELNDVFPGISIKTEGFAQRLTELGKATN